MREYSKEELDALGLQIGCVLKLERLRKGISQEDLGLEIGSNSTTVGRIERHENLTSWKNIYLICQALELEFNILFNLKSEAEILEIIQECITFEGKLNRKKREYYELLIGNVRQKFKNL